MPTKSTIQAYGKGNLEGSNGTPGLIYSFLIQYAFGSAKKTKDQKPDNFIGEKFL